MVRDTLVIYGIVLIGDLNVSSKNRRWGIASKSALESGRKGAECRGEEHEIVLVWSVTSGKKIILMDGNTIYSSTGKRTESKFVWFSSDCDICIIAYAAPPIMPKPDWKQFEFLLRGKSFDLLPQIFQLGITSSIDSVKLSINSIERNKENIESSNDIDMEKQENFEGGYGANLARKKNASLLLNKECELSDKVFDEINPNEPPSLEDVFRGQRDSPPRQKKSMYDVWGRASDISAREGRNIDQYDFDMIDGGRRPLKLNSFRLRRKLKSPIQEQNVHHNYSALCDT